MRAQPPGMKIDGFSNHNRCAVSCVLDHASLQPLLRILGVESAVVSYELVQDLSSFLSQSIAIALELQQSEVKHQRVRARDSRGIIGKIGVRILFFDYGSYGTDAPAW
jgi:hypothetical protein